jgi:hypothetical protein
MLAKNKLELLKKLSIENPNAYVQIGETFHPTRSELYNFEMFRAAAQHTMRRHYCGHPVILVLDEHERTLFESFHDYLLLGTPLDLQGSADQQLAGIFFLKSICSDAEMRTILEVASKPLWFIYFIRLETWRKLMDYELEPLFLGAGERIEICASLHHGSFFGSERGTSQALAKNEYALIVDRVEERTLEEKEPVLAKALKFYRVTLQDIKNTYKWKRYSFGSGGPN